jgi:hypothetical protein
MSGIIDRLARIEKQSVRPKPSLTCYFYGINVGLLSGEIAKCLRLCKTVSVDPVSTRQLIKIPFASIFKYRLSCFILFKLTL